MPSPTIQGYLGDIRTPMGFENTVKFSLIFGEVIQPIVVIFNRPHHAGRTKTKVLRFCRSEFPIDDSRDVKSIMHENIVSFILEIKCPFVRFG